MGYVYAVLWLIIALTLFVRFRKESKAVYLFSAYFLILSGWWLADELLIVDLMDGIYAWILRAFSVIILLTAVFVYYKDRKRISAGEQENKTEE
ncbi:MAG: hypothetical protein IJ192_01575 [Clostridia bacterium]|nr:hypothetical protein [Clostridia bacterium]